MSEEIFDTPELRLRITQLEYEGLSQSEYKQAVQRIYLEEKGEQIPGDIKIYSTSESNDDIVESTGYVGTAIHIKNDNSGLSEMYVVSEGSQTTDDWEYNIKGIFGGQDASQATGTEEFVKKAKNNFEVSDSTKIIGYSHSLAHNNNATAHLLYDTFDDIYSVNGAPLDYYQLYREDSEFKKSVMKEFSFKSNPNLYDISPKKLEKFAQDYYKDKADDIHQIRYENDPLYAVSGTRGLFDLGDIDTLQSNENYSGLRDIMDQIPDEDAKELQALVIEFSELTKNGDMNNGVQELTGINLELIDELNEHKITGYFTNQNELAQMVKDADEKVPRLLEQVKKVTSNSDVIFNQFVKAGYINSSQKDLLVSELTNIEKDLVDIERILTDWHSIRNSSSLYNQNDFSSILGSDIGAFLALRSKDTSIMESLDNLNRDDLLSVLEKIKGDHDITTVLNMLGLDNKSYVNGDMLLKTGKVIINMSAALRMYEKGQNILDDKKDEIKKLDSSVEREIRDSYQEEKRKIKRVIHNIEENPKAYSYLLYKDPFILNLNQEIISIEVLEEFETLKQENIDNYIKQLNESVAKARKYVNNYRNAIEDLFKEEEKISNMFNLVEEEST